MDGWMDGMNEKRIDLFNTLYFNSIKMFYKNVHLLNINFSSVNSANCSNIRRDVRDVKKKQQDLSGQTKKREAERRRVGGTGGGPSTEDALKSMEQKACFN